MKRKKKKQSAMFFVAVFAVLAALVIFQNIVRDKEVQLSVPDNAGVSFLETVDDSLVCVFQDGDVVVWNWRVMPEQKGHFSVNTDRVILLDANRLGSVNDSGKKILSVYSLPSGEKRKDISVGWADQEVWPRISSDKEIVALIRKSEADSAGKAVYEFLTVDIEKELTGLPVSLSIQADSEDFVDFCIDKSSILYAVGNKEKIGRIAAVDLEKGIILWDQTYDQTLEFCSVTVSPDDQYLLVGNRDGVLYKLDAKAGEIVKKIQLLEEGETRPITNDYSVLNLAFSPDGKYYVATINPKAYLLKTDSDEIFHICTPANKLVSKIAFSPDNQFFATSDIRASYPIKIWPMPETE